VNSGTIWDRFVEKPRGQKSRATVPLNTYCTATSEVRGFFSFWPGRFRNIIALSLVSRFSSLFSPLSSLLSPLSPLSSRSCSPLSLSLSLLLSLSLSGRSGQFRGQKGLGPHEKSLELSHYEFCPRKENWCGCVRVRVCVWDIKVPIYL
jgi:hypothetical protein